MMPSHLSSPARRRFGALMLAAFVGAYWLCRPGWLRLPRGRRSSIPFSMARVIFSPTTTPMLPPMKPYSMAATTVFTPPIGIPAGRPMHLRVEIDYERLHFAYRVEGVDRDWRWLPQQFDASILSDEATAPGQPNFTGAFVGMACQDLAGTSRPADFDFFEYRERRYRPNPFSD